MPRHRAPVSPPVALTIAGSDSGGGAGIQADLKTMGAHDVFGTSVLTAVTAQNTVGVHGSHVLPTDRIAAQYDAVVDDFDVGAVKTGMLATAPVVDTVRDCLGDGSAPVVVDPVMVAATGDRLLSEEAESTYEGLIADAALVTPNVDEAEILTDRTIDDAADARAAGEALVDWGVDAALVKGGHLGGERVVDTLVCSGRIPGVDPAAVPAIERFEHPRIDTDATHGSGCALSSAIAARLARGEGFVDAVGRAVGFMERAVRYGLDVGRGPGSVHHAVDARAAADRGPTRAAVEAVAAALEATDGALAPPSGRVDVAGAARYAESADDVAAVDGGLVATGATSSADSA